MAADAVDLYSPTDSSIIKVVTQKHEYEWAKASTLSDDFVWLQQRTGFWTIPLL